MKAPKRRGAGATPVVAFLGPSLRAEEARALVDCTVLPPARQGDVWRALRLRPRAIALVDGVFGAVPSVWHHELLDALDAGVALFGGASMGALRAAELAERGMVGIGGIFEDYRAGRRLDDADVALLHAGADWDFRGLTVPLVSAEAAIAAAQAAGVLAPREAQRLARRARTTFWEERTWGGLLEAAALPVAAVGRWRAFAAAGLPDPKRADAIATLHAAAAFAASGAGLPSPRRRPPSALVRARRDLALGRPSAPRPPPAALHEALVRALVRQLGLERGSARETNALLRHHAARLFPDGLP